MLSTLRTHDSLQTTQDFYDTMKKAVVYDNYSPKHTSDLGHVCIWLGDTNLHNDVVKRDVYRALAYYKVAWYVYKQPFGLFKQAMGYEDGWNTTITKNGCSELYVEAGRMGVIQAYERLGLLYYKDGCFLSALQSFQQTINFFSLRAFPTSLYALATLIDNGLYIYDDISRVPKASLMLENSLETYSFLLKTIMPLHVPTLLTLVSLHEEIFWNNFTHKSPTREEIQCDAHVQAAFKCLQDAASQSSVLAVVAMCNRSIRDVQRHAVKQIITSLQLIHNFLDNNQVCAEQELESILSSRAREFFRYELTHFKTQTLKAFVTRIPSEISKSPINFIQINNVLNKNLKVGKFWYNGDKLSSAIWASVKKTKRGKRNKESKKWACPICFETCHKKVILECKHAICKECVKTTVIEYEQTTCCLCRKQISKTFLKMHSIK